MAIAPIRGIREILRFGVVGIANTAIYHAAYWIVLTQFTYALANAVAIAVAFLGALILHTRFTFGSAMSLKRSLRFFAANLTTYSVLTLGVWTSINLGVDEVWAPLAAAPVVVPVSFLANRMAITGRLDRHQRRARR